MAQLPEEPWGWRMKRAREQYAHLTLDGLVDRLSRYIFIDKSTISRLEKLEEAPLNPRKRQTAYLCTLIYGLDPEQFGVGPDDIPPGLRDTALDLGFDRTGWFGRNPARTTGRRGRPLPDALAGAA